MLSPFRFSFCIVFSFALILYCQPQLAHAQEVESPTSAVVKNTELDTTFLFSGQAPKSVEELKYMEQHFAELAESAFPAVVNIQMGAAQGSGVVISSDGYIMTAAHVVAGPQKTAKITFMLEDGTTKSVKAERLGVDNKMDSGLLKIQEGQNDGEDYPYLDIGISEELNEGQWVMAIGHPGGIDEARGLVVRVGRVIFKSVRVVKTDCTLVGGDSGGPLIDMNGDVIGIHSRIGSLLSDNLHVPADVYSENWDDLAKGIILDGKASLGFNVVDDTNKVESVTEKGPAGIAGLEKGDIVIKLGSIKIDSKKDIDTAIQRLNLRPNAETKIVVMRGDQEQTLKLIVGQR
jgi:serine protease Do